MSVTLGGKMIGVSGIKECDTCKWADIHDGPRTIVRNEVTIIQNGKHCIDCTNPGDKIINMRDDGMKCSGWEAR